jgi:hypothetical protein
MFTAKIKVFVMMRPGDGKPVNDKYYSLIELTIRNVLKFFIKNEIINRSDAK